MCSMCKVKYIDDCFADFYPVSFWKAAKVVMWIKIISSSSYKKKKAKAV